MKKFHFTLFLIIPFLYTNITFTSETKYDPTLEKFAKDLLRAKILAYNNEKNTSAKTVKDIFNNLTHNHPSSLTTTKKTQNTSIEVEIPPVNFKNRSTKTPSLPIEIKKPSTNNTRIIDHTPCEKSLIFTIAYPKNDTKDNPYDYTKKLPSENNDDDYELLFPIEE